MAREANKRIDGEVLNSLGRPTINGESSTHPPNRYNQERATRLSAFQRQPISMMGTFLIVDENGNRLPDTGVLANRIVILTFNAGEFVRVSPTTIGRVMTVGFRNHQEYCWVCIKHDGPDQFVRCLPAELGRVSQSEVEEQLARGYGG